MRYVLINTKDGVWVTRKGDVSIRKYVDALKNELVYIRSNDRSRFSYDTRTNVNKLLLVSIREHSYLNMYNIYVMTYDNVRTVSEKKKLELMQEFPEEFI